jgi:hypothetical protein
LPGLFRIVQQEEVMSEVTVRVPRNLTLEQAQRVVSSIVAKVGHPHCFSGVDIRFASVVDYAADPVSHEVREIGS